MPGDPIQFDDLPHTPLTRAALAAARPLLERVLGLGTCRRIYQHLPSQSDTTFEQRVLEALDIDADCPPLELLHIPAAGPLIVVSNHPHGALDGLLLATIVNRVRPDVKLLANHLLARIPEMRERCFFVDPFGGRGAPERSRAGLRAAHLWLKNRGAVIAFPAGEVAHRRTADGTPVDSPWRATVGRLALATGAAVVPARIDGSNSLAFYALGRLHPVLRTMLLGRELLNKRGRRVRIRVGTPVPPQAAGTAGDVDQATATHRHASDALATQPAGPFTGTAGAAIATGLSTEPARNPCFAADDRIAADVRALPSDCLLVDSGTIQVFCAEAPQIPHALQEIGRLREITFRAVGEGTGRTLDLDRFDERYLHLVSWDREHRRIVGAYRIGRTDRLVPLAGTDGLYTSTLFRYDHRFIARVSPALELGRSFVRQEYQRHPAALLALWKGICAFVSRHPEYRVLFGPVSISTRYSDSTHRLLMAFLAQNHQDASLAELVEAFHPGRLPVAPAPEMIVPSSVDAMNRLVGEMESDGKGMPVLLRQYLRLNARLIGFNVDSSFGDALDALMMVDLTRVERAILNRYFGRDQARAYLSYHHGRESAAA